MERPIGLEATGYSWDCPECGHNGYHIYAFAEIVCVICGKEFSAIYKHEEIQENGAELLPKGNTDGNTLVLIPAAYMYKCPECYTVNTVNSAGRIVKCKKCKAELPVGRYYQRKPLEEF